MHCDRTFQVGEFLGFYGQTGVGCDRERPKMSLPASFSECDDGKDEAPE